MKRLNPTTKELFVRGDTRGDGYRFYKYTAVLKADGTFKEIWLHPDVFKDTKAKARKTQAKNYVRKSSRLPNGWARKLHRADKIAHCKRKWQEMFLEPKTMEWVEDNSIWDEVQALLMPYASDYNGY